MGRDRKMPIDARTPRRFLVNKPALLGMAASMAILVGWSALRARHRHSRRYADHASERRAPLSLFIAGDHPRRRRIDHSGFHPLFERRQSVYESY
jgi:hypothetical protein